MSWEHSPISINMYVKELLPTVLLGPSAAGSKTIRLHFSCFQFGEAEIVRAEISCTE